jgi:LAO/AO transport system kinase
MNKRNSLTAKEYIKGVIDGDRTLLARAITLIESTAPAHVRLSQQVLQELLERTGNSIRIGVTGVPGVGKSTFIETMGSYLTGKGHKVAVMAVDPSSSISGGSILGDKTRMEELSRDDNAFVRPSPSGDALGGVAGKTREIILLCEAAGYDVIFVETVGVGQNEIAVRSMVDFFLLLMITGAGDELQGMKRGVIEIADCLAVNKADGDNKQKAELLRKEFEQILPYFQPATKGWGTKCLTCSSTEGDGIEDIWSVIEEYKKVTTGSGAFDRRRKSQAKDWMHAMIADQLKHQFKTHSGVKQILTETEQAVQSGALPAPVAAQRLLEKFRGAR